ncbi:MAG: winged helix-turn-helix domain-containing protein [Acidobacteria bacterium]|jgi:DNA-binding winged helix-turn-helix (wHTH) protein|nr:winged helix-turn-helix domain-containing protein [Acidobacteriota bacterium]
MANKINCLREFGRFRLDAEKRVLWCEDKPVNLPLKEIELLCVLTENGGEVITKDELLEKVWADSFVEESNLSRHIYILRKTFKDFGES